MGRPPIKIRLVITSKDDNQFTKPRMFYSIPEATAMMGFTDRGIRFTYHSKRDSMRKSSGDVYMLKWLDPIPLRDWKKCSKCSKTLSFKDKNGWFFMHKEGDYNNPMYFKSLYPASRKTGISVCVLRNACEKTNER